MWGDLLPTCKFGGVSQTALAQNTDFGSNYLSPFICFLISLTVYLMYSFFFWHLCKINVCESLN